MKKSFSYAGKIRSRKKERGIAIIFTLGILGLLTVIALGFASTALLNDKLSRNVSGDTYAKSMAKNLALSRAMALIQYCGSNWEFDYRKIHTRESSANAAHRDHLWKLQTKEDGVRIYTYDNGASPAYPVTWEYITAQVSNAAGSQVPGIIGRYAYVVVPDKGRLNPNINVGASYADPVDFVKFGKHLPFRTDRGAGTSNTLADILTKTYRYTSYREAIRKAAVAEASYKEWFDHFGIGMYAPLRTQHVFTHTTGSGSSQTHHYFTKFSMQDSVNWDTVAVADLIGESANFNTAAGSSTGTPQNPDNTISYLPFLNKMWVLAGSDAANQARVRQLAANIIQYNRKLDNTVETVSDVTPADWLTSATAPTYMGIGRHPMINEVGIAVEVTPGHEKEPQENKDASDNIVSYTYYPKYTIKITPGVELIYPFGNEPDKAAEVRLQGTVKVTLQGTKATADYENKDQFNDAASGHFTGTAEVTHEMKLDTSFKMEFDAGSASWNNGYTKAASFWYELPSGAADDGKNVAFEKSYTNTTNAAVLTPYTIKVASGGTAAKEEDKVLFANMKVTNIEFKVTKVLLKYDGKERDLAQLPDTISWNKTDYEGKLTSHLDANAGKPQLFFRSYQVSDPFHNLSATEWEVKDHFDGSSTTNLIGKTDYCKLYSHPQDSSGNTTQGGTLVDTDGITEKHQNHFTASKYNTPPDLSNNGATAGTDPAHAPFAFIRHAPMQHFWEFASIHTGGRWSTLDLTTKAVNVSNFTGYAPALATVGSEEYAQPIPAGELFDQIQFSSKDNPHTEGLVNLNTDSHAVLHALFTHIRSDYRDILTAQKTVDVLPNGGTVNNASGNFNLSCAYNPTTAAPTTCLACAIQDCTKYFAFRQKSDLLIPQSNIAYVQGYDSGKHSSLGTKLEELQTLLKTAPNRIEKSQIIAKMMPFLRTAPVDMVYVIVLAQSIEDAGGNKTIMTDWDGTGMETAANTDKLKKKLGLTYKDLDGLDKEITGVPLPGKIMNTNTYNTYDIGADKITGEAKLIVALIRNPEDGKWRIGRMYYADPE